MRLFRHTLALTVVIALSAAAGATGASLITGAQVKDGSLTGKDIRNRSIKRADLAKSARAARGPAGPAGLKGDIGQRGPQGTPGPAGIYVDRIAGGGTAEPGKIGRVIIACPHGQAVTITPNIFDMDTAQVLTSTLWHNEHEIELSVRNDGTELVVFRGTLVCVDTRPYE